MKSQFQKYQSVTPIGNLVERVQQAFDKVVNDFYGKVLSQILPEEVMDIVKRANTSKAQRAVASLLNQLGLELIIRRPTAIAAEEWSETQVVKRLADADPFVIARLRSRMKDGKLQIESDMHKDLDPIKVATWHPIVRGWARNVGSSFTQFREQADAILAKPLKLSGELRVIELSNGEAVGSDQED